LKLLQFTQQNKYKSVKYLFIDRYLIALLVNSNGFKCRFIMMTHSISAKILL